MIDRTRKHRENSARAEKNREKIRVNQAEGGGINKGFSLEYLPLDFIQDFLFHFIEKTHNGYNFGLKYIFFTEKWCFTVFLEF